MSGTNLIAVVDDDESVRDATRALLRSVGYEVATFESGELFLRSAALPDTACVVLDMRMPGIDGLEVQRQLRASDTGLPIIFVSAHEDAKRHEAAMDAGAYDFFHKPFIASALLDAVQTAVQRRAEHLKRNLAMFIGEIKESTP